MGASLTLEEMRERLADPRLSSARRNHYRRIVNGLCVRCSYPPVPGARMCEVCSLENARRASASRERRVSGGLPEYDVQRGLLLCGYGAGGSRWRVRIDADTAQWLADALSERLIWQASNK